MVSYKVHVMYISRVEMPNEPSCNYVRDTAISSVHFRDMCIDVIAMFCLQMNVCLILKNQHLQAGKN